MNTILSFYKNFAHFLKFFFKNNKTLSSIIILLAVSFFLYGIFSSSGTKEETFVIKSGPLVQSVKVTGSVKATSEAEMSFEKAAPVSYIGVKVGDSVYAGKILATVSSGDEEANLLQAQSSLDNAKATLDQLTAGARKEELAVKEQAVEGAQNNLTNVYATLPDSIRNTDLVTSDIIKSKLASLFTYAGNRYILSFSSCDQSVQSLAESKRSSIESDLALFQQKASTITSLSSQDEVDKVFAMSYDIAAKTNDLVSTISSLLLLSCSSSNTALDGYRTNLSTVKTSISSVFADISSKRTSLTSAKNNFLVATSDLNLLKAGSNPNQIKAQEALVSLAQAKVLTAQSALAKTRIVAPFDGVITDVTLVTGEVATLGNPVVKLISANSFEVETKVREIDVAKLKVGNPVKITLDTYGDGVIFDGVVSRINPSAEQGDVPMYKVIISFKKQDDRIRAKMTANISIITDSKEETLFVPLRFVKTFGNGEGSLTIKKNQTETEERKVTVGILSEDGNVELLSGVHAGDEIVAIQPGVRSAQKQN